jgi:hypothetical protein
MLAKNYSVYLGDAYFLRLRARPVLDVFSMGRSCDVMHSSRSSYRYYVLQLTGASLCEVFVSLHTCPTLITISVFKKEPLLATSFLRKIHQTRILASIKNS